jgi:hypothetical protein
MNINGVVYNLEEYLAMFLEHGIPNLREVDCVFMHQKLGFIFCLIEFATILQVESTHYNTLFKYLDHAILEANVSILQVHASYVVARSHACFFG